jgi:hypothetical protein
MKEIINLSDESLSKINQMLNDQYVEGFIYGIYCASDRKCSLTKEEGEKMLEKVIVPMEPDYFRALLKATAP